MNTAQLETFAKVIAETYNSQDIQRLHRLPTGAETLRLIVRDNLAGAADKITDALWPNL
jgi:hypothetical protein